MRQTKNRGGISDLAGGLLRKIRSMGRAKRRRRRNAAVSRQLAELHRITDALVEMQASEHSRRVAALPAGTPLAECEFRTYSQFGEDGILQHLTAHVPFAERSFVEFGVEDFLEANCRLLLRLAPWRGLVLDGRPDLAEVMGADPLMFSRNLTARSAFITAENINALLEEEGFVGDIGILSIDVDGNDYWIWRAVKVVQPRIVVVEYNSIFGPDATVSVPYKPDFYRGDAHYSLLYSSASLGALAHLAQSRGYSLVGSNAAGNNAFFVRNDVLGDLRPLTSAEAWVESSFRESLDREGRRTWTSGTDRLKIIQDEVLIDVRTDETIRVSDLLK